MKTATVKTDRDNGSFSIISLTECQEALSEGQFGKQTRDTYFVWSWRSRTIGLGDVYQIGIGRCLQWNIVMDDDIGGGVRGVPEAWIRMQKRMENK